jgi:RNA polymerase sigma-B factor
MHPDSLDAVNPNSDAPSIGEVLACPDTPLERLEELACLREAMQDLNESDRELLYRRYFCEETQVQLGKRLGMSQMQVSRRLAKVLVELQRRLEAGAQYCGSTEAGDGTSPRMAPADHMGSHASPFRPARSSAHPRTAGNGTGRRLGGTRGR